MKKWAIVLDMETALVQTCAFVKVDLKVLAVHKVNHFFCAQCKCAFQECLQNSEFLTRTQIERNPFEPL